MVIMDAKDIKAVGRSRFWRRVQRRERRKVVVYGVVSLVGVGLYVGLPVAGIVVMGGAMAVYWADQYRVLRACEQEARALADSEGGGRVAANFGRYGY